MARQKMVKKIYLLGYPLGHSLSPAMHNAAYRALGLDYVYEKLEVPPADLTRVLADLRSDPSFWGANITVPHKKAAVALCAELAAGARECGSVNTLVCRAGGLTGYSTDGEGYLRSLDMDGIDPRGKKIVLFGSGGAAQAMAYALQKTADKVWIIVRDLTKAPAIIRLFAKFPNLEIIDKKFLLNMPRLLNEADLVINATSVGMLPDTHSTILPEPGLLAQIRAGQIFSDIVYHPRRTLFLKNAADRGARTHEGWGMLLWQGVLAFHLFTGIPLAEIPLDILKNSLLDNLPAEK
ncbi:shikimate dehydrogenase [Candidatus Termititenax persephonae]|uniref:Shikimate dehydrogenase (NADP(+)) n=1 Tax=Candidatus Termititenax persephonae TaxID=2218525 RepID=A0A388TEC1_9BACT|nr:shikimate dehydrogenase [Candidatus Termititenax persephonae]